MKFSMSDDEIRVSYNTAKDQKAQVKVLAELNVTTPAAMAVSMPFIPPVLGTTTLLTFLIMLPLTAAVILSGSAPKVL